MDESFREMFEASSTQKPKRLQPGERLSGKVVQLGQRHVVIDLGNGLDGLLDSAEVAGQEVKVGDRIDVFVRRSDGRSVELVRALGGKGSGGPDKHLLEEAYKAQMPVEGTIKEVNKGGFVVDVGGVRAFCPLGQLELRRFEDPAPYVGKAFQFLVIELKERRDAVLSRRKLLEAEQEVKAQKTRESLKVGARVSGTVVTIKDFGAFIDLGGIEALVPASEIDHARKRPADVLTLGQVIEGEVLKMDPPADGGKARITVSMRALLPAPEVAPAPDAGKVLDVTVDRIESFGLFVTWKDGRGLVPASDLGPSSRGHDLRKQFPVGTTFQAVVVEVRPDGKVRLSKSQVAEMAEKAETAAFMGKNAPKASFGTFGDLLKKK